MTPRSALLTQPRTCELCDRPPYCRGWCRSHYDRWLRNGTPEGAQRGVRVAFAPLDDAHPLALASRYGTTVRTIYRWRIQGLPVAHAERLAHLAGCHPLELWPDLYDLDERSAA